MFGNTKYIVVDDGLNPIIMYIFPTFVKHDKFSLQMGLDRNQILSAGFVDFTNQKCFGHSESLNVQSDPETDNKILQAMMRN